MFVKKGKKEILKNKIKEIVNFLKILKINDFFLKLVVLKVLFFKNFFILYVKIMF